MKQLRIKVISVVLTVILVLAPISMVMIPTLDLKSKNNIVPKEHSDFDPESTIVNSRIYDDVIIIRFGNDLAINEAILVLTNALVNSEVISFENIHNYRFTIETIIFVGHGNTEGLGNQDDVLLTWNNLNNLKKFNSNSKMYVIACNAQEALQKNRIENIFGTQGTIDGEIGAYNTLIKIVDDLGHTDLVMDYFYLNLHFLGYKTIEEYNVLRLALDDGGGSSSSGCPLINPVFACMGWNEFIWDGGNALLLIISVAVLTWATVRTEALRGIAAAVPYLTTGASILFNFIGALMGAESVSAFLLSLFADLAPIIISALATVVGYIPWLAQITWLAEIAAKISNPIGHVAFILGLIFVLAGAYFWYVGTFGDSTGPGDIDDFDNIANLPWFNW